MPNLLKFLRSLTVGNIPPAGTAADYGRIAFNIQDRVLWAYDSAGTPRVIAKNIGDYDPTRAYRIGDLAVNGGIIYRSNANINAVAFNPLNWDVLNDWRAVLLYRTPTAQAQATMLMGTTAISARFRAAVSQVASLMEWRNGADEVVSNIDNLGYPGRTFGRAVFRVDQVAHGFTAVGQPIRFDGTNWVLANPATAAGFTMAVVARVISANAFEAQTAGRIDDLGALAFETGSYAANTLYYASTSTPGRLTATAPGSETQQNLVLKTTSGNSGVLGIQRPVGVPTTTAQRASLTVTQSPNPFTAIGQPAAFDGTDWVRGDTDAADSTPVGVISATAGTTFTIVFSGEVTGIESGAVDTFPMTAGVPYYCTDDGRLTSVLPTPVPTGQAAVLWATGVDSGIVIASVIPPISKESLDVTPATIGAVPTARVVTAGNGLTGGGALSANVTLNIGTPSTLNDTTTNAVTAGSHTHALSAAGIRNLYAATAYGVIGAYVLANAGGGTAITPGNTYSGASLTPAGVRLNTVGADLDLQVQFATLSGTWRAMSYSAAPAALGATVGLFLRIA